MPVRLLHILYYTVMQVSFKFLLNIWDNYNIIICYYLSTYIIKIRFYGYYNYNQYNRYCDESWYRGVSLRDKDLND